MTLVEIHLVRDARGPEQIKKLADTIHHVLVSHFNAPKHGRYQLITQHEPWELIVEDSGLGFKRTAQLVIVQITQQGRVRDQKQVLFMELMSRLKKECGVADGDLIITLNENLPEDWSFGEGKAQFLEGSLKSHAE